MSKEAKSSKNRQGIGSSYPLNEEGKARTEQRVEEVILTELRKEGSS